MSEKLSDVEYTSLLFDFYGELLKPDRREIMTLYHEDNLSLSEIAEMVSQSRQGVHYTLRKAETQLREYEDKLGLVRQYQETRKLTGEASRLAQDLLGKSTLDPETRSGIERLSGIIRELTE